MSLESRHGLESRQSRIFVVDPPYVALTLQAIEKTECDGEGDNTLLFPATRQDPSEAIVTERIGTSPAGVLTRY